jgi:predicted metal-dependent hydrolase
LSELLLQKYSTQHEIRTDSVLYSYVLDLKNSYIRNAQSPSKVLFDNDIQSIKRALGTHKAVSRFQGGKLKAKSEIRIASLFKHVPLAFLRMIAVHELAHLKEKDHNKAFYGLCLSMEPDYHQIEFDLRLYLTHLDLIGELDWNGPRQDLQASPET